MQTELTGGSFDYFDKEMSDMVRKPSKVKKLVKEMMNDFVSQTNQAIMINNFALCQKLKKLYLEKHIDVN